MPLQREAIVEVKSYKAHQIGGAFGRFWKLRFRKIARRCGAKHISKSKCAKRTRFGAFLEVEMSKLCAPLWRETHFQVKSAKKDGRFRCGLAWQEQGIMHLVKKRAERGVFFWHFHPQMLLTLPYAALITLHYTSLHNSTLDCITLHSLHHRRCNCM